MTIADIIALAKQGFKPGDIKEIIELSKTAPKDPEPEKAPEPVKDPEPEKAPEPVKDPEQEIDYAAEIEKLKSENEKIKKDLAISQEENRRKPGPEIEEESDEEIVQNVLLKLMR